jgi:prolipoprotein diacylglyceryltransferase
VDRDNIMIDMKNMTSANNTKFSSNLQTLAEIFKSAIKTSVCSLQHYGLIIVIAITFGVWLGITLSHNFHAQKMEDVIATEAMVYKGKVYTVTLK